MPFYGRYINNVILTTGGGLLTGDINDSLQLPSYIAPFLTAFPVSDRDVVIFNDTLDKGGEFVLQWDKHHGTDDKNLRLQVQLRILLDGTLSFVYKNFHQAILDVIDDKGYPLAIGLRDGFAANTDANGKGIEKISPFLGSSKDLQNQKQVLFGYICRFFFSIQSILVNLINFCEIKSMDFSIFLIDSTDSVNFGRLERFLLKVANNRLVICKKSIQSKFHIVNLNRFLLIHLFDLRLSGQNRSISLIRLISKS